MLVGDGNMGGRRGGGYYKEGGIPIAILMDGDCGLGAADG